MHTAAEYRKLAAECFEWAKTALTDDVRIAHLNIARIWLLAASHLDGELPIRGMTVPAPKQNIGTPDEAEPS